MRFAAGVDARGSGIEDHWLFGRSDDGSIAMRIVQKDFCRHLIKRFRKPLVSTSANISGQDSPANFAGISDEIKQGVDYIVKYRQQDDQPFRASAIVRFNKSGDPTILRS